MQQVKFTPVADITSLMTGTVSSWPWEVETVYVNGSSTAFIWSTDGTLSIPSYTSGTVFVEFTLYLIYDAPSQYLPLDPTDPVTELVYWENRLRSFVSFSSSMKAFETGLTEINIGTISIQLDDEWIKLSQQQLIMPNTVIRIYKDGVLLFKGVSSKNSVTDYVMTINVQKRIPILDSECNFGDPAFLCRIDRLTNTSYYNGANIPEQFEGFAIPMLFGNEFPYDQSDYSEIEVGPPNPSFFPNGTQTKFGQKSVDINSVIVQVIPTSATTGILGRMPNFQSLVSSPSNILYDAASFPVPNQRFYKKSEAIANATITNGVIPGEILIIRRDLGATISATRVWFQNKPAANIGVFLGLEEPGYDKFNTLLSFSPTEHWYSSRIPDNTWTLPAVAIGPPTPAGHRWITANFTGINLLDNETFVVFTGITGAKNNFDLMKWILESHGFTVDTASFAAMNTEFPVRTIQQVGLGQVVPTLGNVIAEMNQNLLTILVFPAKNDEPFLKKIDMNETPILTLTERQISRPSVNNEYRNQAANVLFKPRYARSDFFKNALYRNIEAPNKDLFQSQKTFEVAHVMSEINANVLTRWNEMTAFYGAPETTVNFDLFDDEVQLELGDTIYIDHDLFKNKIMVLSIEQKPQGRTISGRYFYVNQN